MKKVKTPKNIKRYFKINESMKYYKKSKIYNKKNKSNNKNLKISNFYINQNKKFIIKNNKKDKEIINIKKNKLGYINSILNDFNIKDNNSTTNETKITNKKYLTSINRYNINNINTNKKNKNEKLNDLFLKLKNYKKENYKKEKWINEKDRLRLHDFLINPWIMEIICKKNSRNNYSQEFTQIWEQEINIKIKDLQKLHLICKDIRYCFYKFFDKETNLKYSKNNNINKIFTKIYPFLSPNEIINATNNHYNYSNNFNIGSKDKIVKTKINKSKFDEIKNKYNNKIFTVRDYLNNRKNKMKMIIYFLIEKSEILQKPMKNIVEDKIYSQKPFKNTYSFYAFKSIKNNDYELLKKLIKQNKDLIFDTDENGRTLLHKAIIKNNFEFVKIILNYFPDINFKDNKLKTPLEYSLKYKNINIIKLLLKNRAIPNFKIYNNELNDEIKKLFNIAIKINILLQFVSNKNKWIYWNSLIKKLKIFN